LNSKQYQITDLSGENYRTLLQVALLGIELGQNSLALDMADHLCELRSDLPHAYIVKAMSVASGRTDESVRMLEETLVKFPDSQLCKVMLGTCMEILKRPGWKSLLESVIDNGDDDYAVSLACALLGRDKGTFNVSPVEGSQGQSPPDQVIWA
jgi:Bacterial type III secretion protein (HrpB1_HrpK)